MSEPLQLNIGCGTNKLPGFINIDVEPSCKPDLLYDFTQAILPYDEKSIDKITFFHTIEHIRKPLHPRILVDFCRVLKNGGELLISYPNFWECAQNWKSNKNGQRTFWHATMFGRQLYPSDHHVCAMDPVELEQLLRVVGFDQIYHVPENREKYNTITKAIKATVQPIQYEDLLANDRQQVILK